MSDEWVDESQYEISGVQLAEEVIKTGCCRRSQLMHSQRYTNSIHIIMQRCQVGKVKMVEVYIACYNFL